MKFEEILGSSTFCLRVLKILVREFGELPDFGCLAGGAVASAVFECLGLNVKYRYADLDIFFQDRLMSDMQSEFSIESIQRMAERAIAKNGDQKFTQIVRSCKTASFVDPFEGGVMQKINKGCYDICESFRIGKFNLISYSPNSSYMAEQPKLVISGFDLNCSQVALFNNRIVFTTDFIDFLYQQTLRCTNFNTPKRTLIRLLKKSKQLGVSYDPASLDSLVHVMSVMFDTSEDVMDNGQVLSLAQAQRFLSYKDKLLIEGILDKKKHGVKITPSAVKSVNGTSTRTLCCYRFSMEGQSTTDVEILKLIGQCDSGYTSSKALKYIDKITKLRVKDSKISDKLLSIFSNIPNLDSLKINAVFSILCETPIQQQHSPIIAKLIKISYEHEMRIPEFQNSNEIAIYTRNLNWLHKHKVHLIRSVTYQDCIYSKCLAVKGKHLDLETYKSICQKVENNLFAMIETNYVRAKLDALLVGFDSKGLMINEITTEKELFLLGANQKHCVGGYFHSLRCGAIIFTVSGSGESKMDLSTVYARVRKDDEGIEQFQVIQHKSFKNYSPLESHELIVRDMVTYFNNKLQKPFVIDDQMLKNLACEPLPIDCYRDHDLTNQNPNYFVYDEEEPVKYVA